MSQILYSPPADLSSQLKIFQQQIERKFDLELLDYSQLHHWSIENPHLFWDEVRQFCGLIGAGETEPVVDSLNKFPGAKWFPEMRLNFAENLLRYDDDKVALIGHLENGDRSEWTYRALNSAVARLASAMRDHGITSGDRVAAYMPNIPETVIGMLAATSIGAIWSSCSPDFGLQGATDRFVQIEPKLLLAADSYCYNGKVIDCRSRIQELQARMPSLTVTVVVSMNLPGIDAMADEVVAYDTFLQRGSDQPIIYEPVGFDHPLYINFSSGTTGMPKCIVHSVGGTLIQHQKEHVLHADISREDVLFFHTTCGWMMWNWLVSALATGCTVVLYDGSPLAQSGTVLIDMIDADDISVFGVSAKYLSSIEKQGIKPKNSHRLSKLRLILSTGSPLSHASFEYVYRDFKTEVGLSSISGGTDIISCFLLGNPHLPVIAGELQCQGLGMAVEFWQGGAAVSVGETGELVCTIPFPSTPICFWNDSDGSRFRDAYFSSNPGVWSHGDYGQFTESGGAIIHGRSDAVLNPSGVRIGTAEIYRQVEQLAIVVDCLAVGQKWQDDERIVLFVVLQTGEKLTEVIQNDIRNQIRANTTPRHVPAKIIAVTDIPRTVSGKIVELAVREVIHDREVTNKASLANPEALEFFRNLSELKD